METNAYFDNIQAQLLKDLRTAEKSITAAVAWFTDPVIYALLCEKAEVGVSVRVLLIDDEINRGPTSLDFTRLEEAGGEVFLVAESDTNNARMHNKFCVIDGSKVITGSYNWSRQAQKNRENITVISGDTLFAGQFMAAFDTILAYHGLISHYAQAANIDPALIMHRLKLIHNLVLLDEIDQIASHLTKLRSAAASDDELMKIIDLLESEQHSDAVIAIGEYMDPEIDGLRLEFKSLEIQVAALDAKKAELKRLIDEFVVRQNKEIGELLIEYLRLKQERLARQREKDSEAEAEYEETKKDYKEYRQELKDEKLTELDAEEKQELKKAYRRASRLCQPNKVANHDKVRVYDAFVALNQAYGENDLPRVKEILSALKQGKSFYGKSKSISKKRRLVSEVRNLRSRREQLTESIRELRESGVYQTIENIGDCECYFKEHANSLQKENEGNRWVALALNHTDEFNMAISHGYQLDELLIDRYADKWDWKELSKNKSLPWSESLIVRFEDQWNVEWISRNESLPWSESLIWDIVNMWDWSILSKNKSLPWSESLIECFAYRWDWDVLSENESLPWSESLIERYADRWDWSILSKNKSLPWSESLIERYADRWDWSILSKNESLPWSLSLVEFFDITGHCPHASILGELIQKPDRRFIVQIMDTMETFKLDLEEFLDSLKLDIDYEDDIPF